MHILINKGDILSVSVKLKLCTMFVLLTKHNLIPSKGSLYLCLNTIRSVRPSPLLFLPPFILAGKREIMMTSANSPPFRPSFRPPNANSLLSPPPLI